MVIPNMPNYYPYPSFKVPVQNGSSAPLNKNSPSLPAELWMTQGAGTLRNPNSILCDTNGALDLESHVGLSRGSLSPRDQVQMMGSPQSLASSSPLDGMELTTVPHENASIRGNSRPERHSAQKAAEKKYAEALRASEHSMAERVKWALANLPRLPASEDLVLDLPTAPNRIKKLGKREIVDAADKLIEGLMCLLLKNVIVVEDIGPDVSYGPYSQE